MNTPGPLYGLVFMVCRQSVRLRPLSVPADALLTTILCFCHHRRRRAMSVMSARDRRLRRFRRGRRTACIRRLRLRRRRRGHAATVSSLRLSSHRVILFEDVSPPN
jgi:hypothetical protein